MAKEGSVKQTKNGIGRARQITGNHRKRMHAERTIVMKPRFDGFRFGVDETLNEEVLLILMPDHENRLTFRVILRPACSAHHLVNLHHRQPVHSST